MSWDFETQKADTYAVFAELFGPGKADAPDSADVDYAFLSGAGADRAGFEAALREAGFGVERSDDNDEDVIAVLEDQPISAMAIWFGEETATQLALAHGFVPDGWGLMA